MGHLRQLANTIVQQAEFGPNEHRIKQLIQVCQGVTLLEKITTPTQTHVHTHTRIQK